MSRIVYSMAEGWLVLTITDSPLWVGVMAGVRGAIVVLFSPLAGVVSDRFDRRKLLIATQVVNVLVASTLGYLTFSGLIELWHILCVTFVQSMSQTVNMPARLTLTMDLVGRNALLNATAASHMGNGLVQIVAPTVAGFVISAANMSSVYVMIAVSAVLAMLAWLRMGRPPRTARRDGSPWATLKEGIVYVFREPMLRSLIIMGLVVETFAWSHITMLPVMARDVLNVGATGFGFLSTAAGIGLMAGTLIIASLGDIRNKGRWMVMYSIGFGVFLVLFSISTWFPLSMVLLAVAFGMGISFDAVLGTLLQSLSADEMRGRVVSFYGLTFGMTPMGGFGAGAIASVLGAPVAIGVAGLVVVANGLRSVGLIPRLEQALEERTQERASPGP